MKIKDIYGEKLTRKILDILERIGNNCYNEGQGELDTTIAKEVEQAFHDLGELEVKLTLDEKKIERIIIDSDLYQAFISEHIDYSGVEKKLAQALISHAGEIIKKEK